MEGLCRGREQEEGKCVGPVGVLLVRAAGSTVIWGGPVALFWIRGEYWSKETCYYELPWTRGGPEVQDIRLQRRSNTATGSDIGQ